MVLHIEYPNDYKLPKELQIISRYTFELVGFEIKLRRFVPGTLFFGLDWKNALYSDRDEKFKDINPPERLIKMVEVDFRSRIKYTPVN